MNQIANSVNSAELRDGDDNLEGRLLLSMAVATAIAVIVSVLVAPWRVTAGLFLGGSLSLLNYHWLHTSVAAIFNIDLSVQRPHARSWRYLSRFCGWRGRVGRLQVAPGRTCGDACGLVFAGAGGVR